MCSQAKRRFHDASPIVRLAAEDRKISVHQGQTKAAAMRGSAAIASFRSRIVVLQRVQTFQRRCEIHETG